MWIEFWFLIYLSCMLIIPLLIFLEPCNYKVKEKNTSKKELNSFINKYSIKFRTDISIYELTNFYHQDFTKEDLKYLKKGFKFRGLKFKVDKKTKQFKIKR